ncbi:hypothetical protein BH10PSE17_BH10PSE17_24370 [soil metagenome]
MAIEYKAASRMTPRPVLSTQFIWDDGSGQTSCSALYLETRNFQRVAVGRAAEARINGDVALAESYDLKAHRLARDLTALRETGHVGRSELRKKSNFSETFAKVTSANLSLA